VDGDTSHISNTIINGSQSLDPDSGSVVYFVSGEDTTSVLNGFTLTGGTGTQYTYASTNQHTGGGVFLWSGGKVENNKIVNNHLTNANNRYTHGAGLEVIIDGNAIIRNNLIAHNSINAWWGGGAGLILGCADNGYLLFENNRVINNSYNASGGHCVGGIGIFSDIGFQGPIYVNANLIKGNQAYSTSMNMALGGGIYIEHASPVLTNNIITENITNGWGGGINVTYWIGFSTIPANPHILNNTIYHNGATWGGGISIRGNNATPLMMNTILWSDSALLDNEIHLTTGGNISVVYSDIEGGYDGEGNVSKEPMLRGENFVLSDSSSCIGAGILSYQFGSTICYAPACCYLGHSRPSTTGLPPDMGACESPLDAPVVGLERQLAHNLPRVYDLKPNYPNPFNPKTTIAFDLPRRSEVTLKIFNVLGEEIAALLSASLPAGSYMYDWDASGMASGVYLYRLEAEGYVETRKMVLMK